MTLTNTYSTLPHSVKTMLKISISLCEPLLRNNDTFYPFAAVDLDGDIQAVLLNSSDDVNVCDGVSEQDNAALEGSNNGLTDRMTATDHPSTMGVIEQLGQQISKRTYHVKNANSVIVYMAFIEAKYRIFTDVIVADVTLYTGATHQFYFPVTYLPGHVTIGSAFTMQAV